ncbi:MAG: pyrroline-5-carboxylate reductase [Acholeplasmatales bacterium]|nr:pyrroline-5-carboxylate reductase [Acholeplasmatales bacterium]
MKFGIIGAGKMGSAIGFGVIRSNLFSKDDVIFADSYAPRIEELNNSGYKTTTNVKLYQSADIVLLAVKPQQINEILEELSKVDNHAKTIITIAAGISISHIKEYLKDVNVARVMPNTPALINSGTSAICFDGEKNDVVVKIFESVGSVTIITEDMMNEVIPLNGSFPAYGYYFALGFIKAGMKAGFTYEQCKELVCGSMIGSAKMILENDKPIEQLIKDVCSPGGTTIEGVKVFDEANLDKIVEDCFNACVKRAYELGKKK